MPERFFQLGSTPCKCGSDCLHENPVHFVEFYHPPDFVFPPHVLKHFANLCGEFHSALHRTAGSGPHLLICFTLYPPSPPEKKSSLHAKNNFDFQGRQPPGLALCTALSLGKLTGRLSLCANHTQTLNKKSAAPWAAPEPQSTRSWKANRRGGAPPLQLHC